MRINNMLRSHRSGADGVVVYDETLRHERPPRPLISERNLFLEVAATPPLGGGECLQPRIRRLLVHPVFRFDLDRFELQEPHQSWLRTSRLGHVLAFSVVHFDFG